MSIPRTEQPDFVNVIGSLTLALLAFAAIPFSYVWKGLILSVLWFWFGMHGLGLAPISLGTLIGLSLIFSFLHGVTVTEVKKKKAEYKDMPMGQLFWTLIQEIFIPGLSMLGLAWVVAYFSGLL